MPRQALKAIRQYFEQEAGVGGNLQDNQKRLELCGFTFRVDVTWTFSSGEVRLLERIDPRKLSRVKPKNAFSTHLHGRNTIIRWLSSAWISAFRTSP